MNNLTPELARARLLGEFPEIDLCKPADISAPNKEHRAALQSALDDGLELIEAEERAKVDVERALSERLKEAEKNRKAPRGLIDPLAWAVGIHDSSLSGYEAAMPWEEEPPTAQQMAVLESAGLWTEHMTRGFAAKLLERIAKRGELGLASPKQVMLLRKFGEANADTLTRDQAGAMIGRRMSGSWR